MMTKIVSNLWGRSSGPSLFSPQFYDQNCGQDLSKGFKLQFHFVENPYFTNTELCKEFDAGKRYE